MNRIDHIVINTRDRTDQAVALFERMESSGILAKTAKSPGL